MGDDLSLDGRLAVRTPMQWANATNAGFSTASASDLRTPVITDGPFGSEHVNVADQRRDPHALLNCIERLVRVTKECPELQWGRWKAIDVGHPSVVGQQVDWDGSRIVTLHNLSPETRTVTLDVDGALEEVYATEGGPPEPTDSASVALAAYAGRWFRVSSSR